MSLFKLISIGAPGSDLLRRFKKQLAESGKLESFKVDNRPVSNDIRELYCQLNEELFGNMLPANLPVVWSGSLNKGRKKTRCYGKAHYTSAGIAKKGHRKNCKAVKIEIALGMSDRMTRKTLVHEMCHAFCFQEFGEVGHGKQFWLKMRKCGYPKGHIFPNEQEGEHDKWGL